MNNNVLRYVTLCCCQCYCLHSFTINVTITKWHCSGYFVLLLFRLRLNRPWLAVVVESDNAVEWQPFVPVVERCDIQNI